MIFAAFRRLEEVQEVLGDNYNIKMFAQMVVETEPQLEAVPFFKRIKKIDIRKEEFDKTTAKNKTICNY